MRRVLWVGAAAAVVLVSGCSSGGGVRAGGASADPSVTASETTEPVEEAVEEPEKEPYPEGPEGDLDRLVDEKGWVVYESYGSASAFVSDLCESLPESGMETVSRPQWLAEGDYLSGDGAAILKAGFPTMCPKWVPTLKAAVSGRYDRWVSAGEYEVRASPPATDPDSDEDVEFMLPGSYRASGVLSDCYWERTSQSGDIIDNQFASQARQITVTVREGELFSSRQCGAWKPVR